MKLEVEKNPPSLHPNGTSGKSNDPSLASADDVELLNHGIRSAQAGNRSEARTALFKVTENDPRNETAWLWLASISEYPEELLVFLNNVLDINPTNERAREWKGATNSLLAKTFVQRGIDAVEGSRKDFAAECFHRALEYDQNNEMAWLWMASLSETDEGKVSYLEMVLKINPDNEAASEAFRQAKTAIIAAHLSAAKCAAVLGQKAEANELLNAVIEEDPNCEDAWMLRSHFAETFEEKIASFKSVLAINPANAAARLSLDSLQSLIGSSSASESVETGTTSQSEYPIGNISGSNLFAYEPEIDRNPTQDLEFPAEKLDEIRDFEARIAAEPVEQPPVGDADQPDDECVEQPTLYMEQSDNSDNEISEPWPEAAAEFEVDGSEEESKRNLTQGFASGPFDATACAMNYPVDPSFVSDDDKTITVSAAEAYISADTPANSFEEKTACETAATESFIDIGEFAFSAADVNEESGPFWEPHVPESSVNETIQTESESPNADERLAPAFDPASDKTEEIAADNNGFHSDRIMIPASKDADDSHSIGSSDDPFATVASVQIPKPASAFLEEKTKADPLATKIEPQYVRTVVPSQSATACSFCDTVNEANSISCSTCLAVLTLSDLDMILGNRHVDRIVLKSAVERMEKDHLYREFNETELTMLGIGHLNLQNVRFGYNYLYEASKLNPNNVVLSSQVNALLIRLTDIRKHEETAGGMCKGKTILVVDDSPTVRKLIAGKLEKSGHNVICSSDGVEAMHALGNITPDLILLDINMPRMDGYQTCKSIRLNEATKEIPVVMISGKDGFFDRVRGRMAGTSGYITKPFGPETLMKTVETYLSGNTEDLPDIETEEISDLEVEVET